MKGLCRCVIVGLYRHIWVYNDTNERGKARERNPEMLTNYEILKYAWCGVYDKLSEQEKKREILKMQQGKSVKECDRLIAKYEAELEEIYQRINIEREKMDM